MLLTLPTDLLFYLSSFLDRRSIGRLQHTSKRTKQVTEQRLLKIAEEVPSGREVYAYTRDCIEAYQGFIISFITTNTNNEFAIVTIEAADRTDLHWAIKQYGHTVRENGTVSRISINNLPLNMRSYYDNITRCLASNNEVKYHGIVDARTHHNILRRRKSCVTLYEAAHPDAKYGLEQVRRQITSIFTPLLTRLFPDIPTDITASQDVNGMLEQLTYAYTTKLEDATLFTIIDRLYFLERMWFITDLNYNNQLEEAIFDEVHERTPTSMQNKLHLVLSYYCVNANDTYSSPQPLPFPTQREVVAYIQHQLKQNAVQQLCFFDQQKGVVLILEVFGKKNTLMRRYTMPKQRLQCTYGDGNTTLKRILDTGILPGIPDPQLINNTLQYYNRPSLHHNNAKRLLDIAICFPEARYPSDGAIDVADQQLLALGLYAWLGKRYNANSLQDSAEVLRKIYEEHTPPPPPPEEENNQSENNDDLFSDDGYDDTGPQDNGW